jgi:hypothetical protein
LTSQEYGHHGSVQLTLIILKILTTVYQTLVQPYFDYCSQVWGGLGTTLCNKLQRLRNGAVRIITKSAWVQSSICKFTKPTWSAQLEERRNQQLNTLMYKVRHEMAPSSLKDIGNKKLV